MEFHFLNGKRKGVTDDKCIIYMNLFGLPRSRNQGTFIQKILLIILHCVLKQRAENLTWMQRAINIFYYNSAQLKIYKPDRAACKLQRFFVFLLQCFYIIFSFCRQTTLSHLAIVFCFGAGYSNFTTPLKLILKFLFYFLNKN